MVNNRVFLHITYKLYGHLDKLSGIKKSNCLNCYLALMKYAWKKNNYECGLRYSTIAKDTKLSRITVRRCLNILEKFNIISTIRGKSGKTYKINQVFLKTDQDGSILYIPNNKMYNKDHSDVYKRAVLEEAIYINKISTIIKDNRDNKQLIIDNLAKLPLDDLLGDKTNPYYVSLAIKRKKEIELENNSNFVHPQKISNALNKIKKSTNFRYRQKKEFNQRNNLDYKGRSKK